VRSFLPASVLVAVTLACAAAPAALADSSESSNWAGYAAHRAGVTFRSAQAVWKEPTAKCVPGNNTYSAYWVGIGGYSVTSNALEQVGTEVDCNMSGREVSSAWYELVPAASQTIRMAVRAGDTVSASVKVVGNQVTVALNDQTSRRTFQKSLYAPVVDTTSAEWILEAPSNCFSETSCQTLPLANFGTASFTNAGATGSTGHHGAITDPAWGITKITLIPGGRRFVTYQGYETTTGAATPSAVNRAGNAFKVSYSTVTVPGDPFFSPRRALLDGYLVHPGR
jgi:Peptidase A4 family